MSRRKLCIVLRAVHPILGTRDLARDLAFYVEQLGFELAFRGLTFYRDLTANE